ncbi:MAG TPA: N-6 DNA methylase [Polyangiaceae bacterium]|nr:N-6 DNA methylase [Polyangiaceae bacterium]
MEPVIERFVARVRQAADGVVGGETGGLPPEAALRVGVEAALSEALAGWGVVFTPALERATVTTRRSGVLCGRVVTEYRAPGALATSAGYEGALEQARDRLERLAVELGEPASDYFGVLLDGRHVGFVHQDPEQGWLRGARRGWDRRGALAVLERFRAHTRRPLDAESIAQAFGPGSAPARALLPALVAALRRPSGETARRFAGWRRLLAEVVGDEAHQDPGVAAWAATLGVASDVEDRTATALFALHTYYALVIEVVTADVVGAARSRSLARFADELRSATPAARRERVRHLDRGACFERLGVAGFPGGDGFAWYLDPFDGAIAEGVAILAGAAAELEPSTPRLAPSRITDLFKPLYQGLVPDRIRHDPGEYYTPDWLADHVLERVGFTAAPRARLLDPACGSGTFLVRAVRALVASGELEPPELLAHVSGQHLVGFDLNPLAVLAARANLLLALADALAEAEGALSLPVYRRESIGAPTLTGGDPAHPSAGDRSVAVAGGFDFVVGNPPWVVWGDLAAPYREAVRQVAERYELLSDDAWVGGIESDVSTVLTYAAADRWLRVGGALGFVITQSVFKTRSAQGFRRFRLPGAEPLGVFHVDDLTSLRPFEDAANRTAALFLRKGEPTRYPVPYLVWTHRAQRRPISAHEPLAGVLQQVEVRVEEAVPVSGGGGAWLTAPAGQAGALLGLLGGAGLRARKGTTTDLNAVYWVRVLGADGALVEVENAPIERGHRVLRRRTWLESELIHPLARGQDLGRFTVNPPTLGIVLPQRGMRAYDEPTMRARFPRALAYFEQYRDTACVGCRAATSCRRGLVHRGSYANPKYGGAIGEYWGVWNVGAYTFAPYKVAWREVSTRFEAAVLGSASLAGLPARPLVPDHKLMFCPCAGEDEAHFLCGVVNSGLVRGLAEAVSLATSRGARLFADLDLPAFDPGDPAHQRVAALSRAAHAGTRTLDAALEAELDAAVVAALGRGVTGAA